jgi:hypothetical protein
VLFAVPATWLALVLPAAFGTDARENARSYAVNLAGGALGTAVALVGLDAIGSKGAFLAVVAVCLGFGVLELTIGIGGRAMRPAGPSRGVLEGIAALSLSGLVLCALSGSYLGPGQFYEGKGELRYLRESFEDTVAVLGYPGTEAKTLWINNQLIAGHSPSEFFYGLLPLALRPGARRALVIGYGTGTTAQALLSQPGLEVDCVEISSNVLRAASQFPADALIGGSARLHIVREDGRRVLARRGPRYDAIIIDSSHLNSSGTWRLFTKEFYRLARGRLSSGGVLVQWYPRSFTTDQTYLMLLKTFSDAFEQSALWSQKCPGTANPCNSVAVGSGAPLDVTGAVPEARRLARERFGGLAIDDYAIDEEPVSMRAVMAGIPVMVDDRPLLEFRAARDSDSFFLAL